MTIEQPDVIDLTATDDDSNEFWLIVSDHLPWDVDEGHHLWILQNKLNTYLQAMDSGEPYEKCPSAKGKHIVI